MSRNKRFDWRQQHLQKCPLVFRRYFKYDKLSGILLAISFLSCFYCAVYAEPISTIDASSSIPGSSEKKLGDDEHKVITTVEGGIAELPCDIQAPSIGDSVYLVLWYRKDSGTPIYSYDSRQSVIPIEQNQPNVILDGRDYDVYHTSSIPSRPPSPADLWSDKEAFGDRAHFRVSTRPAVLKVTGVQRFDAGTYTCRVDFRQAPTVYHHVTLDVIVPPQKPLIMDERGRQVEGQGSVGPFREGDSITLECHVPGGEPLPEVIWYLDNDVLDDSYQQTFEGTVKNGLTIGKLERRHTLGKLRCLASNNNITRPVESSVTLKMLFPPQGAKIQGPLQPFTVGRTYFISCKVWGSNPPAKIQWFRGPSISNHLSRRPLSSFNVTQLDDGNVTVSWVKYIPEPLHHHEFLMCRGSNDELMSGSSKIVQDNHQLAIFFSPSVQLSLGRMVNPSDLEEGDDVYFECNVSANPPAYKLTWWHNGEEVLHNVGQGVIITNGSLVLQKVTRDQAGSYTCEASNVEGDEVSKPVGITIMYKPVCLHHQRTIYGVSAGEAAHISCRVDAHPPADAFTWSFNTSNGGMDLPKDQYTNQGSASLLTYKPKDQMDYGTVLCLAENLVGRQVVPCVYHVIPAGPPDAPRNCTLSNQTQESLQVDCVEGYSSGLTQEFHMEVFSGQNHQLIVNITARSPKLLARGLPPGRSLFLRVYASNSKGRSRSVTFDAYTLRMADKHPVVDGSSKESEKLINESWSSFLLVALLGVALTILIIGAVVILLARMNNASVQQRRRRRDAAAAATVAGAGNHQFPGNNGCHDKYNGDSSNSTGFGIPQGMGENMMMGNNIDMHYNDRRDDPNATSSYNNYDRLGGLYDHVQTSYDKTDTSGGFLSPTEGRNKAGESSNKTSVIQTFPNISSNEANTSQQLPIDKSPDVIPHSSGAKITNLQRNNDDKDNNVNSHYQNTNMQPNTSRFQGTPSSLDHSHLNGGSIPNPNYKGNINALMEGREDTGNSWTRQGGDVSKMYNYGPLAVNNGGTSNSAYPLSKDAMFRTGGVGTTSLYSPAGTSDSSGFSEQREISFSPAPGGQSSIPPIYQQHSNNLNDTIRIGPAGALFSLPHQNNNRPLDNSAGMDNRHNMNFHGITEGKGSPSLGHFSYHNPALTASPYSTLPRRPGAKTNPVRNTMQNNHGQFMNSMNAGSNSYSNASDKHSPLMLELSTVNSFRGGQTSSLERKQNPNYSTQMAIISQPPPLSMKTKVASIQRVTAKTPLLEDDRESCV